MGPVLPLLSILSCDRAPMPPTGGESRLSESTRQLVPGVQAIEAGLQDPRMVVFDFAGHRAREDPPELVAALEEIVSAYPATCMIYARLGERYASTGRCPDLHALRAGALEHCPENSLPFADLGQAYVSCEAAVRSEEMLRKALEINPDSAARSNLARLYSLRGRREECVQEAEEYARRHPEPDADPALRGLLAQARNVQGVCLVELGRPGDALPALEAAMRIQPGNPLFEDNYRWAQEEAAKVWP